MTAGPAGGVAVALLAAGRSTRFGADDKLAAPFRGTMLGLHAARALAGLPFVARWVIVRDDLAHPCLPGWRAAGFTPVGNPDADEGIATSLRLAVRQAEEAGVGALLVCLADMPLVTTAHFAALLAAAERGCDIAASRDGALVSPPAIFARRHFAALGELRGDKGAKALLGGAERVDSAPGTLADVDDPATLAHLTG